MIKIIAGPNAYKREEFVKELKKRCTNDFSWSVYEEPTIEELASITQTKPFMSTWRYVVVHSLKELPDTAASQAIFKNKLERVVLIVSVVDFKKTPKLKRFLDTYYSIAQAKVLTDKEAVQFIKDEAERINLKLDHPDFVRHMVGNDEKTLKIELKNLSSVEAPTLEQIHTILNRRTYMNVYPIINTVMGGDYGPLNQITDWEEFLYRLMGSIRNGLVVHSYKSNRLSQWQSSQAKRIYKKYNKHKLSSLYSSLSEIAFNIVQGNYDGNLEANIIGVLNDFHR